VSNTSTGRWASEDPLGFNAGDSNLYRYVVNNPTNAVDPSGLEEFNLGTNKYGEFLIEMNQYQDGNSAGMTIEITFVPDPTEVNSQDIAFVQVARLVEYDTLSPLFVSKADKNRAVSGGFSLDALADHASGWYGFQNDNTYNANVTPGRSPQNYQPAVLLDRPKAKVGRKLRFEFVTAVIADEGPDKGKIYGAVNWGFWLDTDGTAHPYGLELLNEVPDRWIDAVKEWNAQATDLLRWERNDKNQRPLGPFKDVPIDPTPWYDKTPAIPGGTNMPPLTGY
jgi:hypothetical protein